MKKTLLLIVALTSAPFTILATQIVFPVLTSHQVEEKIHQQGIKPYLMSLGSGTEASRGEWETIIKHISTGDPAWLKLVPLIAPETDAGFAEDLGTALGQAIPKNVGDVMAVINENILPISTAQVCSMPLYNESIPELNEYFVKAVQALYKNNTVQAQKCLNQLVLTVGQSGPFREVD